MAKSIKTFRMSRMTVGACVMFHRAILTEIAKTGAEVLHISQQVPAYMAQTTRLQSAMSRRVAYLSTRDYKAADKQRDRGVGYIKLAVRAASSSLIASKREAGEKLMPQLKRFKRVKDMERVRAIGEVNAMLAVLDNPLNAQAIAAIGLSPDIEALRQANQDVRDAFAAKGNEAGQRLPRMELDTSHEADILNEQYAFIAKMVNAMALVFPSAAVDSFIDIVNGIIQNAKTTIAHSRSNQKPRPSSNAGGSGA